MNPTGFQPQVQRRPLPPTSQRPRTPLAQSGSSSLKRRASQGSLITKPSPVSRFLSRSNAALHSPSLDSAGSGSKSYSRPAEFRTHSLDSRLRVATASSSLTAQTSESTPIWDSSDKGDYPSTLPPTPPEDDDHIAWSPGHNNMLLFETSINREPGLIPVDESPGMDSTSGRGRPDAMGSPSDTISPSSSGESPQSSTGDMDCHDDSWLENSLQTVGEFVCLFHSNKLMTSVFTSLVERPGRSRQDCLSNASIPMPRG